MTPEEENIARIEEELDGARRDLHDTLSAVEAKVEHQVERAETALRPSRILDDNLTGAMMVVGLVGFMLGTSKYRKVAAPLAFATLGYALWSGYVIQRDEQGSHDDGRASAGS